MVHMTTRLASLQEGDYVINCLMLINSISSSSQLPANSLDEAWISENCKGKEDRGYCAPASGINSTQSGCGTQGRWFFWLVGFFITLVFHLTMLNTWNLAPWPHIKLPYGKVETGNEASVIDFVQPNIVTAQPTEGIVSKKLFIPKFSGNTVDYSDNVIIFTTLPPVKLGATLDDEPDNWMECIFTGHIKHQILSTSGFLHPIEKTAGGKVYHHVGPLPFGGLGVFTTHPVHTGDLIVAERPLLILPCGFEMTTRPSSKGLTEEEIIQVTMHGEEECLGIAVKRMTDENQKAFMALANSHTEDRSGPILGIVRTNAYKVSPFW